MDNSVCKSFPFVLAQTAPHRNHTAQWGVRAHKITKRENWEVWLIITFLIRTQGHGFPNGREWRSYQGEPLSSPTKVTTPEIPYSQLLAGDEEEEILNWAETLNPSPTTPNKVQQLKKRNPGTQQGNEDIVLTNDKSQPPLGSTGPCSVGWMEHSPHGFPKTLIQTLIRHYDKSVRIETEKQDNKHKQMLENIHNSARETLNT